MKYPFPRGFNPMVRPSFQTRGNNNRVQAAGRGKKTQMKVIIISNYVCKIKKKIFSYFPSHFLQICFKYKQFLILKLIISISE